MCWCNRTSHIRLLYPASKILEKKRASSQVRFSFRDTGQVQSSEPQGLEGTPGTGRQVRSTLGALWFYCWHTKSMKKNTLLQQKPPQICLFFISHFKKHPFVHTSVSWRHELWNEASIAERWEVFQPTCVRMYICIKAAVAVLPDVGFTVSHFNDTHSSTQSAIVHPSVQPGNMDKQIQMWGQLMYLKNANKIGLSGISTLCYSFLCPVLSGRKHKSRLTDIKVTDHYSRETVQSSTLASQNLQSVNGNSNLNIKVDITHRRWHCLTDERLTSMCWHQGHRLQ